MDSLFERLNFVCSSHIIYEYNCAIFCCPLFIFLDICTGSDSGHAWIYEKVSYFVHYDVFYFANVNQILITHTYTLLSYLSDKKKEIWNSCELHQG